MNGQDSCLYWEPLGRGSGKDLIMLPPSRKEQQEPTTEAITPDASGRDQRAQVGGTGGRSSLTLQQDLLRRLLKAKGDGSTKEAIRELEDELNRSMKVCSEYGRQSYLD